VNKRIASHYWTVTYHTPDLSTLELKWGVHKETIIIHNVYNPIPSLKPTNSAITMLQSVLDRWKDTE
jgi:hypothetical protein